MRRLAIIVALSFLMPACENKSAYSAGSNNSGNPNNDGDSGLTGQILGHDVGDISGIVYDLSGGLAGFHNRLMLDFSGGVSVWGSRNHSVGAPIYCTGVMNPLSDAEVAALNTALHGASLRTIPATEFVVSDCITTTLEIILKEGRRPIYEFYDENCSGTPMGPTTVIDDQAGLASYMETLLDTYGCTNPTL